jgi:hypothetical protein
LDLKLALSEFPSVRVATPEDNDKILAFYDKSALSGKSIKLRSVRSPDFFGLLRYQSDSFTVLLDEDSSGALRGVATLTHRAGYLAGKKQEIAYLGDFRVAFDRHAMRNWRRFYSLLLETNPVPTITCVIDENLSAQNALIRQQRKNGFQYELLAPYRMVNVLGRVPWARKGAALAPGLSARRATAADLPALEAFLDRQARSRAFGYCYGSGELRRRLDSWPSLKPESFFLLEDSKGIAACFALWSPAPSKVNVIERLPWHFSLYRPLIRFPKIGSPLKAMYLTHLEVERTRPAAERRALFAGLFDWMSAQAWERDWHMVSFCDFPTLGMGDSLKGRFLTQEVPMKLFTVRHVDAEPLELMKRDREEPGFEIALV